MSGVVQVSERQQARRENWRLIRRRPGVHHRGVHRAGLDGLCDPRRPASRRTTRSTSEPAPTCRRVPSSRSAPTNRAATCCPRDGRRPRRHEGRAVGRPARRALRRDRRDVHGLLRLAGSTTCWAGSSRRSWRCRWCSSPAGGRHAGQLLDGGDRRRGGSVHPGRRPNRAVGGAGRTRPRLRHIGQAARRIVDVRDVQGDPPELSAARSSSSSPFGSATPCSPSPRLSFLGAGPQPPSPDWGAQVSEGFRNISAGIWWTTFFPAAAIASLVIAANLIADSVQSVLEAS